MLETSRAVGAHDYGETRYDQREFKVTAQDEGADPRKVFVIHGRNEIARRGMFEFQRRGR